MKLPIRLDQFLKLENLVGSGGEAKILIAEGEVLVDGEVETRRGRKLRGGETVRFGDAEIQVAGAESTES